MLRIRVNSDVPHTGYCVTANDLGANFSGVTFVAPDFDGEPQNGMVRMVQGGDDFYWQMYDHGVWINVVIMHSDGEQE
jgi:hypothetical protein